MASDHRIRSARNRAKRFPLHGTSRLLDLERLLHLLRLLTTCHELSPVDPAARTEHEAIVSPLPEGDLADQAAAYLRRQHGECYGVTATRARGRPPRRCSRGYSGSLEQLSSLRLQPPSAPAWIAAVSLQKNIPGAAARPNAGETRPQTSSD